MKDEMGISCLIFIVDQCFKFFKCFHYTARIKEGTVSLSYNFLFVSVEFSISGSQLCLFRFRHKESNEQVHLEFKGNGRDILIGSVHAKHTQSLLRDQIHPLCSLCLTSHRMENSLVELVLSLDMCGSSLGLKTGEQSDVSSVQGRNELFGDRQLWLVDFKIVHVHIITALLCVVPLRVQSRYTYVRVQLNYENFMSLIPQRAVLPVHIFISQKQLNLQGSDGNTRINILNLKQLIDCFLLKCFWFCAK